MALVTLIEAAPWVASTGAPQTVRLAGGGRRAYDHLGYVDWRAGIVEVPKFKSELGFGADGWTGVTMAQNSDIRFHPSDPAALADLAALFWNGCPVTVKSGDDDLAAPIWSTEFTGTIANVAEEGGALTFSVVDNSKKLDVPVTDARFAGTGGIEGDASVEGRLKRRSFGRCWNVECRSLLAAYNIYEVGDPAFRLQSIDTVKDIGRAADAVVLLEWQGSIAATLTTLMNTDVPEGGAVVAPSIACVRWWTQAILLTADIRGEIAGGYVETPAAIAAKLAGLGGVTVANTAAMIAARPAPAGLHIGNEGETIAAAIDRLLLGASLLWYLGTDGAAVIGEWSFDLAPAASLKSVKVSRTVSYPPTKSRRVGYRRNERIHSAGEISAVILAADVNYADGRSVQSLQPDEPGATRGAPAGTFVADKLAEEVIADALATIAIVEEERAHLSQLLTDYLKTMLLGETREARSQALAWMDGEHLHTVQRRETQARIEGDAAIVTDMALIGAKSLDGSAWILDIDTVKVSPTQTYAERDAEISASLTTLGGDLAANVTSLETAIADEAAARATAIDTVTAAITTETSNRAAAITAVQDAVSDEAGARATAITDLQSQVDGVEADLAAQVSTLSEAISDESAARASALTTVNATLTSHDATLTANSASIGTLSTSLASLTTTEADHYTTLNATINGVSATVTSHTGSIATLNGRTKGFWSLTANAGSGATAFIAAQAETSPGVVTSNVAFGAKEVHISNPSAGSGWTMVLRVAGGNVEIYGNLKTTGSVSTPNLISNSVTKVESTLSGSTRTSNGGWYNVLSGAWHTFTLDYAADVLVLFMGRANYLGSSSLIVRMILYNAAESVIGSVEGPSSGDGAYMSNPSFPATWSLSAGTYHIGPQFLADSGDVEMRSGSGVIVFIRYK